MKNRVLILMLTILLLAAFTLPAFAILPNYHPAVKNYPKEGRLIDDGYYDEALELLEAQFDPNNPEAKLLSRIAHAYYEMGIRGETKKEKMAYFTQGIERIEPYMGKVWGTDADKSYFRYWYALHHTMYYQAKGMVFAFFKAGKIVRLADEAIAEDPTFPYPYFLKANIYRAIPFGKYSDKFIMAECYSNTLKYSEDVLFFLVGSGEALLERDWSVERKAKEAEKRGKESDGTPMHLSDREYGLQLVQKALDLYKPEIHEKYYSGVYANAKALMEKYNTQ